MFKFISKLSRIRCTADSLSLTNNSKRTASILLPAFQLQPTIINYASKKYYSSVPLRKKRKTEISNAKNESTLLKRASKLVELNPKISKGSTEKLSTDVIKVKPAPKRKHKRSKSKNDSPRSVKAKPATKRKPAKIITTANDLSVQSNDSLEDPGHNVAAIVKENFHTAKSKYKRGEKLAELNLLLCEIEEIHKYTDGQERAYLYFLKHPNDSAVKRYGVTTNPKERFKDHKRKFGKNIEMIFAPLGQRSKLFMEDLEAVCIQMSKKKLLDDGKSILNHDQDDGKFNTPYEKFQAIVDQAKHPRRPFLIKALNQLVELTLHANIRIEDLEKAVNFFVVYK